MVFRSQIRSTASRPRCSACSSHGCSGGTSLPLAGFRRGVRGRSASFCEPEMTPRSPVSAALLVHRPASCRSIRKWERRPGGTSTRRRDFASRSRPAGETCFRAVRRAPTRDISARAAPEWQNSTPRTTGDPAMAQRVFPQHSRSVPDRPRSRRGMRRSASRPPSARGHRAGGAPLRGGGGGGLAFSTRFWWGGLLAAAGVAGNHLCDVLDGTHARTTGQCRNGGELLDTSWTAVVRLHPVRIAVSCGRLDLA